MSEKCPCCGVKFSEDYAWWFKEFAHSGGDPDQDGSSIVMTCEDCGQKFTATIEFTHKILAEFLDEDKACENCKFYRDVGCVFFDICARKPNTVEKRVVDLWEAKV